jgi:hypothetical protein
MLPTHAIGRHRIVRQRVGWVSLFAKPITMRNMMGIAFLRLLRDLAGIEKPRLPKK